MRVIGVEQLNFLHRSFEADVKNLKEVTNPNVSRTALERPTKEGDSPVSENIRTSVLLPE